LSPPPADAAKIFHDTAGWKHLETSMRYQNMIEHIDQGGRAGTLGMLGMIVMSGAIFF